MDDSPLEILLVEDSPEDADLLQEFLEDAGQTNWKLTVVDELRFALEQLHKRYFNIILSDLSLPDAYGLETITQLHVAVPSVPIVVLTNLKNEGIALEAVRQGAQDYLVKGQINSYAVVQSIRYAIERARMQQVMHQQSVAIAAATEGIAILNAEWNYLYVNEAYAKIYGYEESTALMQQNWSMHYSSVEQARLHTEIKTGFQKQGFWRGEAVGNKYQGMPFDQELSITSLPSGGAVCVLRDISERKRAEAAMQRALQQAQELHRLKSDFITMVSHEFRTPLSVILAATESLKRYGDRWSPDKAQIRYDRIINGVQRMTELLNDMLFMNRTGDEKTTLVPVYLNLEQFCRELIATFDAGHIFIQFNNQGTHSRIGAYPTLLQPILNHLLSNAVKYSPKDGQIIVELNCTPEEVLFSVQDQGIGIPPADQEQLFTPFHRGSNVGNISGTGVGLAIVKQCIDRYRGTVYVDSQLNQGTLITVLLPVVPVEQIHDQNPCD